MTNLLTNINTYFPIADPTWIFYIVLTIILFTPILSKKFHIPSIVGLVLAGVFIGPYGFNILERDMSFEIFGKVGLYYIMFQAGLGMDLSEIKREWRKTSVLSTLTILIPFAVTFPVCYFLLGYKLPTSLILSCILVSHTLVTYPIVTRFGLEDQRCVTIAVASTMLALITALLILAGVADSFESDGNGLFLLILLAKCCLFCFILFVVISPIIHYFFRRTADNVLQFIFVLGIVFFSAALSEVFGLEGILGAFLGGILLHRFIPTVSPLMNRINFIGNALFIPYFLIGVGMLINMRILFNSWHGLIVISVIVILALGTKWIAAFLTQKIFKLKKSERNMIFGLTAGHSAGALAIVMVGATMLMGPGIYVMNDEAFNVVVMLIFFSCIISSFVTENAATMLSKESGVKEFDVRKNEKIFIALSNPDTVKPLVNLALMMRSYKAKSPLTAINIVVDDEHSHVTQIKGEKMLGEAKNIANAVDIDLFTQSRYAVNVASGLIYAAKEVKAPEVLIGMHKRNKITDTFKGEIVQQLINNLWSQIFILRPTQPLNTLEKIHVIVPEYAELELGFRRWLTSLSRLAKQIDCNITYYAVETTCQKIMQFYSVEYTEVRQFCKPTNPKDNMLPVIGKVSANQLIAFVMARPNSISYSSSLEKIPMFMERYFSQRTLILIYPNQNGDNE